MMQFARMCMNVFTLLIRVYIMACYCSLQCVLQPPWTCIQNSLTLVKRSDGTNGKSLLTSGQNVRNITSRSRDALVRTSTASDVSGLKIVPPPSPWHLQAVGRQDFFGPHRGCPLSAQVSCPICQPTESDWIVENAIESAWVFKPVQGSGLNQSAHLHAC